MTRPSYFKGVPPYFEALWYPHPYFDQLFADLQGPICYKDPQNKGINLIVLLIRYNRVKFARHFHINYDLNLETAEFLALGLCDFAENSVQRKALMRNVCSREIFTKKCRQQQNFDSDPKEAWYYNHLTFTPIAKKFMLYYRLIYMLSMLYVRLPIKVKVGIPESFKVGWYSHKIASLFKYV